MSCEVAIRWCVSEEDHVQLIVKDETFAEASKQAREFLAVIRAERLLYNDLVQKPLFEKNEELEEALVAKQRELARLNEQIAAHQSNGLSTNGLLP